MYKEIVFRVKMKQTTFDIGTFYYVHIQWRDQVFVIFTMHNGINETSKPSFSTMEMNVNLRLWW